MNDQHPHSLGRELVTNTNMTAVIALVVVINLILTIGLLLRSHP